MWKITAVLAVVFLGVILFWPGLFQKETKQEFYAPQQEDPPPVEPSREKTKEFSQAGIQDALNVAFSSDLKPLAGQKEGQTNFLLLGTPGLSRPGSELTDTIMIAMVKFPGPQVKLVSIPRDLAVQTSEGHFAKINSIYQRNLQKGEKQAFEATKNKLEKITGLNLHYYIKIDLEVLKTIVKKLGGVNVQITEDIKDTAFPASNYSYQTFEVQRGWRYLDAEEAVKFIRTRHSAAGDLDRTKRQKALAAALILKLENMSLFEKFSSVLHLRDDLRQHISSNLSLAEMKTCYALLGQIELSKVEVAQPDTRGQESSLENSRLDFGNQQASVLIPRAGLGNYEKIHSLFQFKN